MGKDCNEKIPSWEFIKFVWNFIKESRPKIIEKMMNYDKINKVILKNRKEGRKFLIDLQNEITATFRSS